MHKMDEMVTTILQSCGVFFILLSPSCTIYMATLNVGSAVMSVVCSTRLFQLQTVTKAFLMPVGSVLTAYPIIRKVVVCAVRGLRQVNNP